jgi:hypothetical protein
MAGRMTRSATTGSKNLYTSERKWAYLLGFTEDYVGLRIKMERCNGMLVRPVINK